MEPGDPFIRPDDPSHVDPDVADTDDPVAAFWRVARVHAKLNDLAGYLGVNPLEVVQPPTWSFSADTDGLAAFEALARDGETELVHPAGTELDSVGTLGIVLDHTGRPRLLVVTEEGDRTGATGQVVERLRVLHAELD